MKKRNHIQKLSTVLNTTGLGLFLSVGLSGCDGDYNSDKCKDLALKPQSQIDECKNHNSHHGGVVTAIPTSNGYFGSSSSSSHSESVGG